MRGRVVRIGHIMWIMLIYSTRCQYHPPSRRASLSKSLEYNGAGANVLTLVTERKESCECLFHLMYHICARRRSPCTIVLAGGVNTRRFDTMKA
jgi:hypothetical protein